jgi:hypothetical protein
LLTEAIYGPEQPASPPGADFLTTLRERNDVHWRDKTA